MVCIHGLTWAVSFSCSVVVEYRAPPSHRRKYRRSFRFLILTPAGLTVWSAARAASPTGSAWATASAISGPPDVSTGVTAGIVVAVLLLRDIVVVLADGVDDVWVSVTWLGFFVD